MFFFLSTPEYNKSQLNTTKVKVHLRNGIAEILDMHQDLMGTVENNIVEIETSFENKNEKTFFILQDAVFVVSTKGLDKNSENKGTGVYVYASRVKEINSTVSLEDLGKQYEQKTLALENEKQRLLLSTEKALNNAINSNIYLLTNEVEFWKKVITIVKDLRVK